MIGRRGLPAIVAAALCAAFVLWLWPLGRAESTPPVRSERFSASTAHSEHSSTLEVRSERFSASRMRLTQNETATPTPPLPTPAGPMPTIDRLAPPPTVENPTQADQGAQVYWLNCQPCHGDAGQGLTDEWRAQYPEDHQNCWTSGCHGERPYDNGFTLPTYVPPVTGQDSLQSFDHMGLVLAYVSAAMPYNAPGSLTEEEYLQVAAFLAREHGVWDGQPLRPETAPNLRLRPGAPAPSPAASPDLGSQALSTPAPPGQTAHVVGDQGPPADEWTQSWPLVILLLAVAVIVVALFGGLWRRGRRPKQDDVSRTH